jgi:hypothetical protein
MRRSQGGTCARLSRPIRSEDSAGEGLDLAQGQNLDDVAEEDHRVETDRRENDE